MIKQTLIFRVYAAILDNLEYSRTDLMCWLDIEAFKRIPHQANAKRDDKAKDIREKYLNKKYFFGPSSPATKDEQNEVGIFHPFILRCLSSFVSTLEFKPNSDQCVQFLFVLY